MSTQTVAPSATPTADFEQHVEAEYRDALGRAAGTVYYDSLGHRRVVTAPMFEADNGTVTYGHEAEAASAAHFEAAQAEHKRVLARLTPSARRAYGTHLRTRCLATPVHAPAIAKPRPRGAGRPRARTATRSSAKSGDSGTDSDESEPPRTAPCACGDCDRTVSPGEGATHPACRKRQQREREQESRERRELDIFLREDSAARLLKAMADRGLSAEAAGDALMVARLADELVVPINGTDHGTGGRDDELIDRLARERHRAWCARARRPWDREIRDTILARTRDLGTQFGQPDLDAVIV